MLPGNIHTEIWSRRYSGIGTSLLGFSVHYSISRGYSGRVSLHASDADALEFYRKLNERVGGELFHPECTGIDGVIAKTAARDRAKAHLETTEHGAVQLLEGFAHV